MQFEMSHTGTVQATIQIPGFDCDELWQFADQYYQFL